MNEASHDPRRPLVIRGGLVLDAPGLLGRVDILVQDGTIVAIGAPGMPAPDGAAVVDASRRLLHPGLVNAHTHGHGNLSRSMGDRWTLELLLAAAPHMSPYQSVEEKAAPPATTCSSNSRCRPRQALPRWRRPMRRQACAP
jgi:5-methylthioadenosine/S-adenosylhomocysteine deaminase